MSTTHKRKRNGLFYSRGEETVGTFIKYYKISQLI
ncbi:hemolysin III family protein, partial [Bacteroides stercoris]